MRSDPLCARPCAARRPFGPVRRERQRIVRRDRARYGWNMLFPKVGMREPIDCRNLAASYYAADPCSPDLFPPGAAFDIVEHLAMIIGRLNEGLDEWPNTAQIDHAHLTMRMQRRHGRIASGVDQIWPAVSPFMFRSTWEMALRRE